MCSLEAKMDILTIYYTIYLEASMDILTPEYAVFRSSRTIWATCLWVRVPKYIRGHFLFLGNL